MCVELYVHACVRVCVCRCIGVCRCVSLLSFNICASLPIHSTCLSHPLPPLLTCSDSLAISISLSLSHAVSRFLFQCMCVLKRKQENWVVYVFVLVCRGGVLVCARLCVWACVRERGRECVFVRVCICVRLYVTSRELGELLDKAVDGKLQLLLLHESLHLLRINAARLGSNKTSNYTRHGAAGHSSIARRSAFRGRHQYRSRTTQERHPRLRE